MIDDCCRHLSFGLLMYYFSATVTILSFVWAITYTCTNTSDYKSEIYIEDYIEGRTPICSTSEQRTAPTLTPSRSTRR